MNALFCFGSLYLLGDASGGSQQPTPSWTDKEVLIAIASVVGALIPVVLFVIRFAVRFTRSRLRKVEAERNKLQQKVEDLERSLKTIQDGGVAGHAALA